MFLNKKVIIIHFGTDVSAFKPAKNRFLKKYYLSFFGGLNNKKRAFIFLETWNNFHEKISDT